MRVKIMIVLLSILLILPAGLASAGRVPLGDGPILAQEGGTALPDLSETLIFVFPEKELVTQVNYPDGWVAEVGDGAIVLANSQTAFDASQQGDGLLTEGDLVILVETLLPNELEGDTLDAMFTGVVATFTDENTTFSDPTPLTEGEMNALKALVTGEHNDGALILVQAGEDALLGVLVAAAKGHFGEVEPLVDAIAATLSAESYADLPDLTQTADVTSPQVDAKAAFSYPDGWVAARTGDLLVVGTSEDMINITLAGETLPENEQVFSLFLSPGDVPPQALYDGVGGASELLTEPATIYIGDTQGLLGHFSGPIGGNGATVIILQYEEALMVGLATTEFENPGDAELLLEAMLATVTFSEGDS